MIKISYETAAPDELPSVGVSINRKGREFSIEVQLSSSYEYANDLCAVDALSYQQKLFGILNTIPQEWNFALYSVSNFFKQMIEEYKQTESLSEYSESNNITFENWVEFNIGYLPETIQNVTEQLMVRAFCTQLLREISNDTNYTPTWGPPPPPTVEPFDLSTIDVHEESAKINKTTGLLERLKNINQPEVGPQTSDFPDPEMTNFLSGYEHGPSFGVEDKLKLGPFNEERAANALEIVSKALQHGQPGPDFKSNKPKDKKKQINFVKSSSSYNGELTDEEALWVVARLASG